MKTRIRIGQEDIEGLLVEGCFALHEGMGTLPEEGDAALFLRRNSCVKRFAQRIIDGRVPVSSPSRATVFIIRLVVEDGTHVFVGWDARERPDSLPLPRRFETDADDGTDDYGYLLDTDDEDIFDCNHWKRVHTIEEEDLWQRECRQAKPAAPAKAKAEAGPEYVFRCMGDKGDFWQIVFEGRELEPVRHLAGMTFLHALLGRPGHDFTALELYRMENKPPPEAVRPHGRELSPEEREQYGTGGTPTRVMDMKLRKDATKRKAELEEELQDPDLDRDGRDKREEEIERLDKALASGRVPCTTGGATFEPKEDKQPRQAVAARIEAAIDAIAEKSHGGNLAKHLRAVRKGKTLRYDGGLTWET